MGSQEAIFTYLQEGRCTCAIIADMRDIYKEQEPGRAEGLLTAALTFSGLKPRLC